MSQTIIALCAAEQLASTIPNWQRYGIQFANTSERLNRFQAADCILCLPERCVPFTTTCPAPARGRRQTSTRIYQTTQRL